GVFTWLYHFPPNSSPTLSEDKGLTRLNYRVDDVDAALWQRADVPVEAELAEGKETLVNPITGTDYLPGILKAYKRRERERTWEVWATDRLAVTTEPVRKAHFLTVLLARREGAPERTVEFLDGPAVVIRGSDEKQTVSFTPAIKGDVQMNVPAIAAYAEQSEPYRLPLSGELDQLEVGGEPLQVEWLRHENFDGADWQNRWFVENQNALVRATDEGLEVTQPEGARGQGTTAWLRAPLPADVVIRLRARTLESDGFNACNLNAFISATEADGSPVRFNRPGVYTDYHQMNNYLVTFTGGSMEGWSRLRRDPGFNLIHDDPLRTEPGKTYDILYVLRGGRVQVFSDGQIVHDWTDPDPLPGGLFGLRTWSSDIVWEQVDIGVPRAPAAP
ncbi:MAG: DUF6250 domain-containing protein, partial [Puniceicoccales bacterium]